MSPITITNSSAEPGLAAAAPNSSRARRGRVQVQQSAGSGLATVAALSGITAPITQLYDLSAYRPRYPELNISSLHLPAKFTAFEPGQSDSVLDIAMADKRFTFLSAPTGSGKSLVCYASSVLSNSSGRTLYLIRKKAQQNQWHRDFGEAGLANIYGHSAYPCASTSYGDEGNLEDMECEGSSGGSCDYEPEVTLCNQSKSVLTNIAHWVQLQKSEDPGRLGEFDRLVIDEAHLTHDTLSDILEIPIYEAQYRRLLNISLPDKRHLQDLEVWKSWAIETIQLCDEQISMLSGGGNLGGGLGLSSNPGLSFGGDKKLIRRLQITRKSLSQFIESVRSGLPWVIKLINPSNISSKSVALKPVWSRYFAEQYLFRGIKKIVLCSATLPKEIAGLLGIDYDTEVDYISVPSTFRPDRRPVYYRPANPPIAVDSKMSDDDFRRVVRAIDQIIDEFPGVNTIIHTRSYRLAEDIYSLTTHRPRVIMHGRGVEEIERAIEEFVADPIASPKIIISPALEEGFDFPFDKCRLQIIVKVPFLDLRDPVIRARCDEDRSYSDIQTAITIEQTVGRGMRNRRDYCLTYIIDSHWGKWARNKFKPLFEPWFNDGLRNWNNSIVLPTLEEIRGYGTHNN